MRTPRAASVLVLATFAALPALARTVPTAHQRPAVIAGWKERLQLADEQLRATQWKKGASVAANVLAEMRERIAGGEGTAPLLGLALLFRAIGEAGLGDLANASWDYSAAQALYSEYAKADLTPYGPAGVALAQSRLQRLSPTSPVSALVDQPQGDHHIVPPRKIHGDGPTYPKAKRDACVYGPTVIETIINEQGIMEYPAILSPSDPVLALTALDALRKWRFKPALLDGKPVRVYYNLTVNFRLPVCRE
jgi:hypothetical protein